MKGDERSNSHVNKISVDKKTKAQTELLNQWNHGTDAADDLVVLCAVAPAHTLLDIVLYHRRHCAWASARDTTVCAHLLPDSHTDFVLLGLLRVEGLAFQYQLLDGSVQCTLVVEEHEVVVLAVLGDLVLHDSHDVSKQQSLVLGDVHVLLPASSGGEISLRVPLSSGLASIGEDFVYTTDALDAEDA